MNDFQTEVQPEVKQQQYQLPEDTHWRFEKRLNISTLLSIVSMAVLLGGPIFIWGRVIEQQTQLMDTRIQLIELQIVDRNKQDQSISEEAKTQRLVLLARMDKFDEQINLLRVEMARLSVAITNIPPRR